MTIKMTVTTDIQGTEKGYVGVKKHTEHDPQINPSNKDIMPTYSQYNTVENGAENVKKISDWQESQFGEWLEERNAKQREKGHAERQIAGVKAWLKTKKKYTGVLTMGSMETTNELMRLLVPAEALETRQTKDGEERVYIKLDHPKEAKRFYSMYQQAFDKWLNAMDNPAFTKFQKIGRHAMHVDELGAPHLHYEVAYAGKTAKGRPTPAVDAALKTFWKAYNPKQKVPSSRAVWSWYRSIMDEIGARALNSAIKNEYGKDDAVKLIRKSKEDPTIVTGLTMEQVKAIHAEKAKAQEAVAKLNKEISAKKVEKAQLTKDVKEKQDQVKTLDDKIFVKDAEVDAKTAKSEELDKTIKHQRKRKDEVETEVASLKVEADRQDKELTEADESHKAMMSWWASEEEDARARRDSILADNRAQEERKKQLSADLEGLQTAVGQQQGLFDQITNNLKQWIEDHLKSLTNLSLNKEMGERWVKQGGNTYTDNQTWEADQFDDLARITDGVEVPRRYVRNTQLGKWVRLKYDRYQRQQRNLRERTGATGGADYLKRDDGPDL